MFQKNSIFSRVLFQLSSKKLCELSTNVIIIFSILKSFDVILFTAARCQTATGSDSGAPWLAKILMLPKNSKLYLRYVDSEQYI